MTAFIAGVIINCIAILVIIINGVKDSLTLKYGSAQNKLYNVLGIVLSIIVLFSFYLMNNGHMALANAILWGPAAPLALLGVLFLFLLILKPNWRQLTKKTPDMFQRN